MFYADLNFEAPQIHKFRFSIVTNTGTNSIADKLGAEGFQYDSREWTLVARPLNTDINMTYQVDNRGALLSWKEYDGIDFKCYKLKGLITGDVNDLQINNFLNSNYIGEQGYYYIYVVDENNTEHMWGKCVTKKYLPTLKLGLVNNQLSLIWSKPLFKDNIAEFQVFQDHWDYSWTKIGTLSNNDTSVAIVTDGTFAKRAGFLLYCVPRQPGYISNTSLFSSSLMSVYAALKGPKFENPVGISCSGFYFYLYSSSLHKYILYKYTIATDSATAITNYQFNWDISPNCRYLLITGDSLLSLYDLNANATIKSVNIKKIVPAYYSSRYLKISDNGICVMNTDTQLSVYDILNEKMIATIPINQGWVKISPNGKYVINDRSDSLKIFRVNESSLTYLAALSHSSGMFGDVNYDFLPSQEDLIYSFESGYMKIRSSQDLSVIRSMNIGGWFFNIDFCSGKIFTAKDASNWNIYDFNTGNLLRTLRTDLGTGASNYTLLTDNTIYYTGYKMSLDN
jgi:hypothetical protein